jgi:hypothetical protein
MPLAYASLDDRESPVILDFVFGVLPGKTFQDDHVCGMPGDFEALIPICF